MIFMLFAVPIFEAVAIPTCVQIFVFIATMLAGRVIFSVPMLFGGAASYLTGGLLIIWLEFTMDLRM